MVTAASASLNTHAIGQNEDVGVRTLVEWNGGQFGFADGCLSIGNVLILLVNHVVDFADWRTAIGTNATDSRSHLTLEVEAKRRKLTENH